MSSPKPGNAVAMTRTDDDSWDITESVGATALGVALARAQEAAARLPAVHRSLCAGVRRRRVRSMGGGHSPAHMVERIRSIVCTTPPRARSGSTTSSSRRAPTGSSRRSSWPRGWMPGAGGCRGWTDSVVYEIDQPKVLVFKTETLRSPTDRSRRPGTSPVAVDLRAGLAERRCARRSLIHRADCMGGRGAAALPACRYGQDLLFERIDELSAPGQPHRASKSFGAGFFDPEHLASTARTATRDERTGLLGARPG